MAWTSEQQLAIESRGNLIVSAAAGAGKTAVLTERLFRLIQEGIPVESLLVLTFTRAAAAEMKDRIQGRLQKAAEGARSEEQQTRLFRAAAGVSRASISTIDAFCTRIVKRYGHLLSLPPSMRVVDEEGAAELRAAAEEAVFGGLAKENDPDLAALYRALGSERAAVEAVLQLDTFLTSQPYPEAWLEEALRRYDSPEYQGELLSLTTKVYQESLALRVEALTKLRDPLPPEEGKVASVLDEELSACRGLLLQKGYANYRAGLLSFAFVPRLTFPKDFDPQEKKAIQAARDALKKCIREQCEHFSRTEEGERQALVEAGAVLHALARLTRLYREAFALEKRRRQVMDFGDIGHFALAILDHDEVAKEYREKYQYIAVDEYQDTNRVNEAIVSRIARPDNRFLVGDVKQSIYGFRQAEPSLFLEKLSDFSGERGQRIDLSANFRSAPQVIDCVNETFSAIMTRESAGMDYDDRARLVLGALHSGGKAELHLIEKGPSPDLEEPDEENPDEALSALLEAEDAELEALLAAERIRDLMQTMEVFDKQTGENRPLRYGDVAVLMRTLSGALAFSRALAQAGIPCYAQTTGGYFESIEVVLMLNCLSLIDNPQQDIPLAGVMLSPMGGFTPSQLAKLRAGHPQGSFYTCVQQARERDSAIDHFLTRLEGWREESRLITVEQLIAQILRETGFAHIMGAMLSGSARRANLEALLERARSFEEGGARGLSAFLAYMETVRGGMKLGSAQFAQENVVRVMSMHKSKGLEYPVVICCGLQRRFNRTDSSKPLVLHSTGGLGLKYIDVKKGCRVTTCAYRAIARTIKNEQLAEEMRILYVALTRARQKLICMGALTGAQKLLDSAEPSPSAARVTDANNLLTWMLLSPRKHLDTFLRTRESLMGPMAGDLKTLPPEEPALTERLFENLSWVYPHGPKKPLPKKTSVSRIAAGLVAELVHFNTPAFLTEVEGPSAAAAGTATHALLQLLPLRALSQEEVREILDRCIREGSLDAQAAERIPLAKVADFTQGSLWARMMASPRLEQELPFHQMLPAGAFFPEAEEGETIALQGVIDCCFMEDGAWVLLDYKTDRIPRGTSPAAVAEKHRTQLSLYARALEQLTGIPVKERLIVLLNGPVVVEFME
ncbi:MAG: helicase-exonuclease AddAB subunit AddA [Clostridia bacterium]|nr:helicase-exonuclease AddAB subunit AddA [Clostridia bacterium]